ncbi:MAG: hypothetical protein M1829_006549 [Trizodia sp. TS-e1964]|nr:MAG: hypothetical protein M1829_006549 [Trizodia sp. TS-e1964]
MALSTTIGTDKGSYGIEQAPGKDALPQEKTSLNEDAMKLAAMGYTQDMPRNFSVWSIVGIGFALTNSWWAISAALVAGINSGGPVLIIYGILLLAVISTCVGISLSELASAFPNAGGQYFWANELAPKKYANFASYLTGWFAWLGAIFTTASVALAVASALLGSWQLSHPEFVIERVHVFVGYQAVNGFALIFNCYGKILPSLAHISLWTSLVSFLVILIVVPGKAPSHQDAKFVFATFFNNTGWENNGIAFIVGLINPNWAFACLDAATHMAEEVPRPERMVPIAIMLTVAIGFVTAWSFAIAICFSIQDLDGLITLVPMLELFYQSLRHKTSAIFLETLIVLTGLGCMVATHSWQARLCWSFARDRGLPGSRFLAKVHPRLDVPLRAHIASCVVVAVVGCLYLASSTAFNSMLTASIVLLYNSYAIPVACLLVRGRENIKHGPFWMGPFGLLSNVVLLAWTTFTFVLYSFPVSMPVEASTMNYVCVVYAVVFIVMIGYWLIYGKLTFRRRDERLVQAEIAVNLIH